MVIHFNYLVDQGKLSLALDHNWFTLPTCSSIFVLWRGCIFVGNYIAWRFYSFMEHCGKRLLLNWLRPLPIWKEKSVSSLIKLHSFSKLPSIELNQDWCFTGPESIHTDVLSISMIILHLSTWKIFQKLH